MATTPDPISKIGWLASMWGQIKLVWRLLKDKRVPPWLKLVPILGVAYVVSPVDIIPDVLVAALGPIPLADDLGIIALSFKMFIDWSPAAIVAEHRNRLAGHADGWDVNDSTGSTSKADDADIIDAEVIS